jgi:GDP/UDP-N,N'-diacetylbacillosamine 2-epimerase (hydrolysing)
MLRGMRDDPYFQLDLVACDMHGGELAGGSLNEITEDFKVSVIADSGSHIDNIGRIALYLASYWEMRKPDLVVLYGDRGEVLSAAMMATELCIPIAHLQGGDTSGTMDDRRRDAIADLSSMHFVSCKKSQSKLLARSIQGNMYIVGDSHLDPIISHDYADTAEVYASLNLETDKPVVIVLHHPDPTDPTSGAEYTSRIMDAIDNMDRQLVLIHPCNDTGYEDCVKALNWYRGHDNIQIHKNLPSRLFLGLMAISDCIVGNSSCGIIEAPYLDLPCVNVGHRQRGRLRSNNVIDVGSNVHQIEKAFFDARNLIGPFDKPYGDGSTGEKIITHIKEWHSEA